MAQKVPFLFCRYSLLKRGSQMTVKEQFRALKAIKGQYVAHWKRNPTADDFDTLSMKPSKMALDGHTVLTWFVGYKVDMRSKADYVPDDDDIEINLVAADGIKFTYFVALPELGVLAANDRVNDIQMGARAGISRFKSVFRRLVKDGKADIKFGADRKDVDSALRNWSLTEFSFSVCPFNPSPKKLGKKLHDMLVADHAGASRGVLFPAEGKRMRQAEDGYIEEVVGLTQAGYGQFGLKATTPEGRPATYGKPKFSLEKSKNEKQQQKPQPLKVYVNQKRVYKNQFREVAKALLDFYG